MRWRGISGWSGPRNCPNRNQFSGRFTDPQRRRIDWKPPTSILGCCLAALPLIGCAGSVTALRQDGAPVPTVTATPPGGVYASGPAAPAAVLVLMPGMNARSHDDFLPSDPAFWTAQGSTS
jgi:hypothetical protein